ncbi:hypothetical protein C8R43DRAFT_1046553 [Mycena crocata]|nr:hypothetical protein C8R43DRAFT_1046553 [Mycena crocata]
MASNLSTIEKLCHDKKTRDEATRLYRSARNNTAVGSGFDLGEKRTGLDAVCAYLASQQLNNTEVTFEAAQVASCQNKVTFQKLYEQVQKALATRKPAQRRDPLTHKALLQSHCPKFLPGAIQFMDNLEAQVMEQLPEEDSSSDDDITLAVFMSICNVIEGQRLFHASSFAENYETNEKNIHGLNRIIKTICGRDVGNKIREDYNKAAAAKSASVSPRKSPSKPQRVLPTRDSPQKRKVTFPDPEGDLLIPDSPTKRQKVAASSSLVTLESIRQTRSMSSSPTKPVPAPSTPRRTQRLAMSPSKSPAKLPATPNRPSKLSAMDIDDPLSSSEEEDYEPAPRRRFRPVFRDQQQWAMGDPRIAKLTEEALARHNSLVKRYGVPFQDYRNDQDVAMDSD